MSVGISVFCRHYVPSRIAHDGLPASCGKKKKKKTNTALQPAPDIAGIDSTQPYTYSQIQTRPELTVPSLTLTARLRHCWNWQYPALHLQPDPDTAGTASTQSYTFSQIQTWPELTVPSFTLTARSRRCWNWQYPALQPDIDTARIDSIQPLCLQPDPDTVGTGNTQPCKQL